MSGIALCGCSSCDKTIDILQSAPVHPLVLDVVDDNSIRDAVEAHIPHFRLAQED